MRWNHPFGMNSQNAFSLLWDFRPDPKATENNNMDLAPKGADASHQQILKQSLSPHTPSGA